MPIHNIEPVFNEKSRILILGSFPSVKSREGKFFYDHPQNRFWKTLAGVLKTSLPVTHEDKKAFLLKEHIALWDVLASCEIKGSADSSIQQAVTNDVSLILNAAPITAVFCNGAAAFRYYEKYILPSTGIKATKLPSTSAANAAFSQQRLWEEWGIIREYL